MKSPGFFRLDKYDTGKGRFSIISSPSPHRSTSQPVPFAAIFSSDIATDSQTGYESGIFQNKRTGFSKMSHNNFPERRN